MIRPCQFCYRTGFLSDTSRSFLALWNVNSFRVQRTFSTIKIRRISASYGCRALLGALYLFSSYALRCQSAFRYLIDYLGINLLTYPFKTICSTLRFIYYLVYCLIAYTEFPSCICNSIKHFDNFICFWVYLSNFYSFFLMLIF